MRASRLRRRALPPRRRKPFRQRFPGSSTCRLRARDRPPRFARRSGAVSATRRDVLGDGPMRFVATLARWPPNPETRLARAEAGALARKASGRLRGRMSSRHRASRRTRALVSAPLSAPAGSVLFAADGARALNKKKQKKHKNQHNPPGYIGFSAQFPSVFPGRSRKHGCDWPRCAPPSISAGSRPPAAPCCGAIVAATDCAASTALDSSRGRGLPNCSRSTAARATLDIFDGCGTSVWNVHLASTAGLPALQWFPTSGAPLRVYSRRPIVVPQAGWAGNGLTNGSLPGDPRAESRLQRDGRLRRAQPCSAFPSPCRRLLAALPAWPRRHTAAGGS